MFSDRIEWLLETNGHCCIGLGAATLGSGLLTGTSSLVGGKKGASSATKAAEIQADAAREALALEKEMFEDVKTELRPFIDYGVSAIPSLQELTGTAEGMTSEDVLTAPLTSLPEKWDPSLSALQERPGYKFSLQEGLTAATSGSAAAGLGRSGSAVKAATKYAQGLAETTYQSEFDNWLAEQKLTQSGKAQTYDILAGEVGTGLSAAGALGGVSTTVSGQLAGSTKDVGTSLAAGEVGSTKALTSGLTGASSGLSNALIGASSLGLFGGSASSGTDTADIASDFSTFSGSVV